MDRGKLVVPLLALSVFCFDIYGFLSTPPPISSNSLVLHYHSNSNNLNHTLPGSLNQTQNDTIHIEFASLTTYRGASMSIMSLVQKDFPGINVTLSQHHPDWTKYIATKLITIAQVLIIMIVMAGNYIFFYLKMTAAPSWYHPLAEHKFSAIAIPWLLGCIAINYLQNTEPFFIFFNHELVFCKQVVGRFPRATEIKEIIRSRLAG